MLSVLRQAEKREKPCLVFAEGLGTARASTSTRCFLLRKAKTKGRPTVARAPDTNKTAVPGSGTRVPAWAIAIGIFSVFREAQTAALLGVSLPLEARWAKPRVCEAALARALSSPMLT